MSTNTRNYLQVILSSYFAHVRTHVYVEEGTTPLPKGAVCAPDPNLVGKPIGYPFTLPVFGTTAGLAEHEDVYQTPVGLFNSDVNPFVKGPLADDDAYKEVSRFFSGVHASLPKLKSAVSLQGFAKKPEWKLAHGHLLALTRTMCGTWNTEIDKHLGSDGIHPHALCRVDEDSLNEKKFVFIPNGFEADIKKGLCEAVFGAESFDITMHRADVPETLMPSVGVLLNLNLNRCVRHLRLLYHI